MLKVVLLGALAFATTTSFISCKDYDDDINRIDDEIGQINQSLDELKTSIGNAGVKSVTYDSTTGKLTIVDLMISQFLAQLPKTFLSILLK